MRQKVDRKRVRLEKGFGMRGLERMDFESGQAKKKRWRELGFSHLSKEGPARFFSRGRWLTTT
jgi:hypothetical protein